MIYPTAAEFALHPRAAERLARSYRVETNGCWRWLKALTTVGYGHFHFLNAYYQAHRFLFVLSGGRVPDGMNLDHLCRKRWCVNPEHLEAVTHAENVRRGAGTKLTPDQVRVIHGMHRLGLSQRAIGRALRVDHSTVSRILNGHRWGHIAVEPKDVAA